MGEANRTRINTLKWFLDFIQEDLDSLDGLELSKKQMEAIHYFDRPLPITQFLGSTYVPSKEKNNNDVAAWKALLTAPNLSIPRFKMLQSELKLMIDSFFASPKQNTFFEKPWDVVLEEVKISLKVNDGFFEVYISIPDTEHDEKLINNVKIRFFFALSGIHRDNLHKCDECEKYFVHVFKKEKRFCSHKCASKFIARKYRDEHLDEYRKKQREIMRRIRDETKK